MMAGIGSVTCLGLRHEHYDFYNLQVRVRGKGHEHRLVALSNFRRDLVVMEPSRYDRSQVQRPAHSRATATDPDRLHQQLFSAFAARLTI